MAPQLPARPLRWPHGTTGSRPTNQGPQTASRFQVLWLVPWEFTLPCCRVPCPSEPSPSEAQGPVNPPSPCGLATFDPNVRGPVCVESKRFPARVSLTRARVEMQSSHQPIMLPRPAPYAAYQRQAAESQGMKKGQNRSDPFLDCVVVVSRLQTSRDVAGRTRYELPLHVLVLVLALRFRRQFGRYYDVSCTSNVRIPHLTVYPFNTGELARPRLAT
ncbi:hypothetical protein AK830_g6376 [Neonectria ditissima]|uniref:Uncharacterized protein n=1 Tax=Neonectria ditissima TaxID=78410 RepID=A0A0N8H6X6_9HYPO|nr:hypothetical protein AK830_g6376 [Neonectria ditissima]